MVYTFIPSEHRRRRPVKLPIAAARECCYPHRRQDMELKGKSMPVVAIFLFAVVAAPFSGLLIGGVDKQPETQHVQVQHQDIKIDGTEEQTTMETEN